MHLFCNCKFVDMFRCDVSDWLSAKFFYDFNLGNRLKLFGFQENNGIFQLKNGLLLYARFLNYRCKYSKSREILGEMTISRYIFSFTRYARYSSSVLNQHMAQQHV